MLELTKRSNLLEAKNFEYALQDIDEPQLYREHFPYTEVPRIAFNHRVVPIHMPDDIWITDTTFRDGQQSRTPYTVEQIVQLYKFLHRLGGPKGLIRQSEFFLYSERDRAAVEACRALGYEFPQITSWIRASQKDFQLVKDMQIQETGILVSCSDYHIFQKLKMKRGQAMEHYLSIVKAALETGIKVRCHFEDITRADIYGFVIPFAIELRKLSEQAGTPVKLRVCDTMGYGVSTPGVAIPRSVGGIIYGLLHHAGFPSAQLEWHGHNDFYRAVSNASAAWLYGASAVNCSLLGIGERTGNCPLEAMVFEYAQLRGTGDGMDIAVITEIAQYYERELNYRIPARTPFVGSDFNITRAGIHADGILKNEEIYNIFDTENLLNRPVSVAISNTSGASGIAHWLQQQHPELPQSQCGKTSPVVLAIKAWVDQQYEGGRVTSIADEELEAQLQLQLLQNG